MAEEKQAPKEKVLKIRLLKDGVTMPVHYDGKWLRVGKDGAELVESKIHYQSRIEIDRALEKKELEKY